MKKISTNNLKNSLNKCKKIIRNSIRVLNEAYLIWNQKKDVSLGDYRIFETSEFLKKIEKISQRDKSFIQNKLTQYIYPQIKDEPHYGNTIKKLVNYNPETWRYRIGRFRLFYVIDESDKIIYLISIDLRKDAY